MTIKETARKLRNNMTASEKILWQELRNRKINNRRFLRQYPLTFNFESQSRFFVLDFYCHELKLGIESDEKIHESQIEYDLLREYIIRHFGITIIGFTNEEINNNLDSVLSRLNNLTL